MTVDFATEDYDAFAGTDYAANSGGLTFAPDETVKTITVLVNGNTTAEPDKNFLINLTNASVSAAEPPGWSQEELAIPGTSRAHLPDVEKRVSMQWATRVNEGFRTLRRPLGRAQYLLDKQFWRAWRMMLVVTGVGPGMGTFTAVEGKPVQLAATSHPAERREGPSLPVGSERSRQ
mgnify:CR=1 FL=1